MTLAELVQTQRSLIWELRWHRSQQWSGYTALPGWAPLIRKLHEEVKALAPQYRINEVHPRDGRLRYYIQFGDEVHLFRAAIVQLRADAEALALHICELCGDIGELTDAPGTPRVRCASHRRTEPTDLYSLEGLSL